MKRAYLIEIHPTKEQITQINQTIGVCRYVYNLYISKNKEQEDILYLYFANWKKQKRSEHSIK